MEETLLVIAREHIEHVFHLFRVYLIGLRVYLNLYSHKYFTQQFSIEEAISTWTFAAFFHDLVYGIEKLKKFSEQISETYRDIGKMEEAKFSFSKSNIILVQKQIMDSFDNIEWYHPGGGRILRLPRSSIFWESLDER